jgi:endonuclease YncB( thermonuclease family)
MPENAPPSSKSEALRGLQRYRLRDWIIQTVCVLAAASVILDHAFASDSQRDDWARFDRQPAQVISVIDGQTIDIRLANSNIAARVHLLGVASCNQAADERAAQRNPSAGRTVILRLEPTQTRDSQGRLLAYAYLDDRTGSVNVQMVQEGFAILDRRCDCMLSGPIRLAESEARKKHRGLWADPYDVAMPPWRREWQAEQKARRDKILAAGAAE